MEKENPKKEEEKPKEKEDTQTVTKKEESKDNFYLRYNVGHKNEYGVEFLEFEIKSDGRLRYANNSNYKKDNLIRKEVYCNQIVIDEIKKIILDSGILKQDDSKWPKPNMTGGSQELEIILGKEHISFATYKIGSSIDIYKSADPKGLEVFYYLAQNIKCFVLALVSMHFRVKPV